MIDRERLGVRIDDPAIRALVDRAVDWQERVWAYERSGCTLTQFEEEAARLLAQFRLVCSMPEQSAKGDTDAKDVQTVLVAVTYEGGYGFTQRWDKTEYSCLNCGKPTVWAGAHHGESLSHLCATCGFHWGVMDKPILSTDPLHRQSWCVLAEKERSLWASEPKGGID